MDFLMIKQALVQGSNLSGESLFSEGKSKTKWLGIKENPYYQPWNKLIQSEALEMQNELIPELTYSIFMLYEKTGSRKEYESVYFNRRRRLNVFSFMSLLLENETKYIDFLEDIIWSICDEYTWCLPAHLTDKPNINGEVPPPKQQIDLFASETAFTLAEITFLLADKLSNKVIQRVKMEIFERVLEPYCSEEHVFFWETSTTNWASVCGGSIGSAAFYLIDDTDKLAKIIERVINTMGSYLKGFHGDGVCIEGIGYWNYGFGYFVYFSELLRQRTANTIDLLNQYKTFKIALFHQNCYLSENYTVSFSDADPQEKHRVGLLHFLKRKYSELEVPEDKYKMGILEDPNSRWAPFIRDFLWSDCSVKGQPWRNTDVYYRDAQWFIVRSDHDGIMYSFAAKAGYNNESHNHNDVGSFIVHVQGETLVADIGAGEYTKQYFQKETRYTNLCARSKGHSVPIIGDKEQAPGNSRSTIIEVKQAEDHDIFSFEMAGAYANENLNKLTRTFRLNKSQGMTLEVEDYYEFINHPESIVERLITYYEPKIKAGGIVEVQGNKYGIEIHYDSGLMDVVIKEHHYISHELEEMMIYSIDFEVDNLGIWNRIGFQIIPWKIS